MDPFTTRRVQRFVTDFRVKTGQLPTEKDFDTAGFDRALFDAAVKDKVIEKFYVTLTNGTIVKGYKLPDPI